LLSGSFASKRPDECERVIIIRKIRPD
jgi:hypothetical protein